MTTQNILIRDETKYDAAVITEVTFAAFESMEISNHTEQFIIEALRSARALTLSLVVFSYCKTAKQGSLAGTGEFIQLNVEGTLVSGERASISVANSVHWHTSKVVRELAESMIADMSNGAFARQWPQISLTLPVDYPAVSDRPGKRSRRIG